MLHLKNIRAQLETPLLRKDFIIDPYQVYEARLFGADAILLIVAALDPSVLKELLDLTHSLDMNAIVEVHDDVELERALDAGGRIIGINNRDLRTFDVDLNVSINLSKKIPRDKIVIAESGISSIEDIDRLRSAISLLASFSSPLNIDKMIWAFSSAFRPPFNSSNCLFLSPSSEGSN